MMLLLLLFLSLDQPADKVAVNVMGINPFTALEQNGR
jgi:hypothetical protein